MKLAADEERVLLELDNLNQAIVGARAAQYQTSTREHLRDMETCERV